MISLSPPTICNSAPKSKVLAASFKTPRQALDCLLAGCEAITLPLECSATNARYPCGTVSCWEVWARLEKRIR